MNDDNDKYIVCMIHGKYVNNKWVDSDNYEHIICIKCHKKQLSEAMVHNNIHVCIKCFDEYLIQKHKDQQERNINKILTQEEIDTIKKSYYDPISKESCSIYNIEPEIYSNIIILSSNNITPNNTLPIQSTNRSINCCILL